jgi:hypothetical protein
VFKLNTSFLCEVFNADEVGEQHLPSCWTSRRPQKMNGMQTFLVFSLERPIHSQPTRTLLCDLERESNIVDRIVHLTGVVFQAVDIVFYGDSIFETWRGTDMGRLCDRCNGAPEVFHKFFSSRYNSLILAVGGEIPSCLHAF